MVLQYKDIHAFDNCKTIEIISVCTELLRSPYIEHAGEVDISRPKTSMCYHTSSESGNRVLHSHSMLIKMYLPLHSIHICLYVYIVFTVSQFHADAHSFKLHKCFV